VVRLGEPCVRVDQENSRTPCATRTPVVRLAKLQRDAELEEKPDCGAHRIELDVEQLRLLDGVGLGQGVHVWLCAYARHRSKRGQQILDADHEGNGNARCPAPWDWSSGCSEFPGRPGWLEAALTSRHFWPGWGAKVVTVGRLPRGSSLGRSFFHCRAVGPPGCHPSRPSWGRRVR